MSTLSTRQLAKNSIGDFFRLPDDYNLRIAKYTNLHLQEQEGVKTRQIYGNLCSIANGTAFSVPTHGTSLIVCVFAARRLYVAVHKLRLIRRELLDRGLGLRPFLKRDWMIPVTVSLTAMAITWGVSLGLEHLVPVSQLSLVPMSNPDSVLGGVPTAQVAQHAGHVVSHAVDQSASMVPGADGGLHSVSHHVHATVSGFGEGFNGQISSLLGGGLQHTTNVPYNVNDPTFLAQQAGFLRGARAAELTEQAVTAQLGAMAFQFASDKLDYESMRRRNAQAMTCRRLPWSTKVVCQECVMPIESGLFFHSCDANNFNIEDDDPDDDEYDVCWRCYNGLQDFEFKSRLRAMYFAVPGDSFHPGLNAVTLVDLLGPKTLLCMACDGNITNGWYYDCWDCREIDKRWTFCQMCYRQGGGCARNKAHRLFAFPRARIATFDAKTPYQTKGSKGAKETGRAACTKCQANIERGAYYHCSKCDKGDYVLCTRCHASERHCLNSSHVLTKYYAWKYRRDYDVVPASKWQCSNPDCLNLMDADRDRDWSELGGGTGKAEEVVVENNAEMVGEDKKGKKEKEKKKSWTTFVTTTEKTKRPLDVGGETPGKKRMKFKFFYSCRESACDNREYGLCPACYFTDLTCPVKGHDMFKCYFTK